MKKRIIILLILFCSLKTVISFSQNADSAIEIKLKIIEAKAKDHSKHIALSITLINHLDSDIFLPRFRRQLYAAMHLYIRENNGYKELNFFTGRVSYHHGSFQTNDIALKYDPYEKRLESFQDSIFNAFLKSPFNLKIKEGNGFDFDSYAPLFLGANQVIKNYSVICFDHLFKEKGDYKISFKYEQIDRTQFPEKIFNYKRLVPAKVNSNIIYYSNTSKSHNSFQEKREFIKNVIGHWCYAVKDSIDFDVSIIDTKDSIFCRYSNVLKGGNILNAEDGIDKNDWAFAVTKSQFLDTTKAIILKNYYNSNRVNLSLKYNYTLGTLIWNIQEEKNAEKLIYLPLHLELKKCKNNQ